MFDSILSLEVAGFFGGGGIGNLLSSWEQMGVFTYALPFLLIFAIVFGILSKINVFGDNKGLNAVVAIVIGLLALQFELVPVFFSEIFPRLGVALSILLALIVLLGLFFDKDHKGLNYGLLAVGVIIFITVIVKSTGNLGWYSGYWWSSNWQRVVAALAFFGIIMAIINSVGGGPKRELPAYAPILTRGN